ncbi:DUF2933 domain-containing protein [Microvirga mediterraneensis]|uniref:DUF2933 domain-containing protein n=1 Tax=Microvirga mediterraneensis TaxID=2754695 RepID=A0A838BGC3_9HYPH|nr:DUF2933 domain-containing protein [Microvirga mediterraneensis]
MNTTSNASPSAPTSSRTVSVGATVGWALTLAPAALGVYLFLNHAGHGITALSSLLLLTRPLKHVFVHESFDHRQGT